MCECCVWPITVKPNKSHVTASAAALTLPIKAFADGVHQLKRYPGDTEFLDVDVAGAPFVGFEVASSALKSPRCCTAQAA